MSSMITIQKQKPGLLLLDLTLGCHKSCIQLMSLSAQSTHTKQVKITEALFPPSP